MESTSISDVRRMCQCGAFRAYVQGGKVFLEDTATGQVVPAERRERPGPTRSGGPHPTGRTGAAAAWSGCLVPVTLGKAPTRTQTKGRTGAF